MKWARVLIGGLAVPLASILFITAVATAYAFTLAFAVRAAPNQAEFSLEMIAAAALLVAAGWVGGVIASSFSHTGIAQRPPENR